MLATNIEFVSREEWDAKPPLIIENFPAIPTYVFIHHTYIPCACYNLHDCIEAMRFMQRYHVIYKEWDDIGYSFVIGSDGRVYVACGWDRVGAHTRGYNSVGLGMAILGDYRFEAPDQRALDTLEKLIEYGVQIGKISPDYVLRGHRDMVQTEGPGDCLYEIIKTWPHF